jgi:hypothetical protein
MFVVTTASTRSQHKVAMKGTYASLGFTDWNFVEEIYFILFLFFQWLDSPLGA